MRCRLSCAGAAGRTGTALRLRRRASEAGRCWLPTGAARQRPRARTPSAATVAGAATAGAGFVSARGGGDDRCGHAGARHGPRQGRAGLRASFTLIGSRSSRGGLSTRAARGIVGFASLCENERLLDPVLLVDAPLEAEGLAHLLHIVPHPGSDVLVAGDAELVEARFDAGIDQANALEVLHAIGRWRRNDRRGSGLRRRRRRRVTRGPSLAASASRCTTSGNGSTRRSAALIGRARRGCGGSGKPRPRR